MQDLVEYLMALEVTRDPPDLPPSSAGTKVYNTEQRFHGPLGKLT